MSTSKTMRLVLPQWQGGNNELYVLGSELLAWLAPLTEDPVVRVPVEEFRQDGTLDDGMLYRSALLRQLRTARELIDRERPDRIAVLGGDCLAAQAPFAYLNEKYGGGLGILWIDAHSDVKTTADTPNAHAMVLGNLLGEGDRDFSREVARTFNPKKVMYAGLREEILSPAESAVIDRLGLKNATPESLVVDSSPVLDWVRENGIKRLAIHLDLDVIAPAQFRSVMFAKPGLESGPDGQHRGGEMEFSQVTRLIADVTGATEVVGLSICEHLPWDAMQLKQALARFPILN
ncbi:arginase family protein [Arthrobacter cavernae]|uniref:Arginase family protein n=1 Tax=Arthrobacter cavernae TaxID=2817681 RepID=A0A939HIT7_9MICC|nr:arginase family protein [Arthrobacter cavernae]MBO1268616.1 arginase family protein [Arthrobacter cavernae]